MMPRPIRRWSWTRDFNDLCYPLVLLPYHKAVWQHQEDKSWQQQEDKSWQQQEDKSWQQQEDNSWQQQEEKAWQQKKDKKNWNVEEKSWQEEESDWKKCSQEEPIWQRKATNSEEWSQGSSSGMHWAEVQFGDDRRKTSGGAPGASDLPSTALAAASAPASSDSRAPPGYDPSEQASREQSATSEDNLWGNYRGTGQSDKKEGGHSNAGKYSWMQ